MLKTMNTYFTPTEKRIWGLSVLGILISHFLFGAESLLTLIASLIGVTSLIFNAKGNPFGQLLMILFSLLYGIISHSSAYYGEMITYLGMTMPMSILALIAWLRNPSDSGRAEVRVGSVRGREAVIMWMITGIVTVIFYFILKALGTASLAFSTLSVTTSFLAVYLTFRRSPLFAMAYAANDLVLIVLWVTASLHNIRYLSVIVCFAAFLINDVYGFVSWQKMKKRQMKKDPA